MERNEQSTIKVAPKDNTDHNRKNYIIYPKIEQTYYNKAKTIENILPIQEEVIIEPKIEKITINPDTKIWEDNIRIIKGIEFTDEDRNTALNIINCPLLYIIQIYTKLSSFSSSESESSFHFSLIYSSYLSINFLVPCPIHSKTHFTVFELFYMNYLFYIF